MPTEPTIAQKLRANLAALRQQGAPRERIEQELARAQEAMNAQSAADPERKLSGLDTASGALQGFADNASFGAVGLIDDAASVLHGKAGGYADRFRQARDDRKSIKARVREDSPWLMSASELAGSVANPVNRILGPMKAGAGMARMMLGGAAEAATQGALQQVGENVGTTEGATGDLGAVASTAGFMGAGMGGLGKAVQIGSTVRKAMKADRLGEAATKLRDATAVVDDKFYGLVKKEARANPTNPAMRRMLEDEDLAPLVKLIDSNRRYRNSSDATKLQLVYKLLSRQEGQLLRQKEGSPQHLEEVAMRLKAIPILKNDILRAVERESQSVIPGTPAVFETVRRPQFDAEFQATPLQRGQAAPSPQLKTAAELRAERLARSASERGDDWAAREAQKAVDEQAGMSAGWETQPQGAVRQSMDRADVRRELGQSNSPNVDPDASPYAGEGKFQFPDSETAGRNTAHDAARQAVEDFRARLGGQAQRETRGAAGSPFYTERAYPKGQDDLARRWEQTFAREEPIRPTGGDEGGEWVTKQVGMAPVERRVVQEAVPPRIVKHAPAMPTLRKAIGAHREMAGFKDAFNRGADMAEQVMFGSSLRGDKILKKDPVVWKEEIGKMSKQEAEYALQGALGRLKEAKDLRVPVSRMQAALMPFRAAMAPANLREYLELLAAQAGHKPRSTRFEVNAPAISGRLSQMMFEEE